MRRQAGRGTVKRTRDGFGGLPQLLTKARHISLREAGKQVCAVHVKEGGRLETVGKGSGGCLSCGPLVACGGVPLIGDAIRVRLDRTQSPPRGESSGPEVVARWRIHHDPPNGPPLILPSFLLANPVPLYRARSSSEPRTLQKSGRSGLPLAAAPSLTSGRHTRPADPRAAMAAETLRAAIPLLAPKWQEEKTDEFRRYTVTH